MKAIVDSRARDGVGLTALQKRLRFGAAILPSTAIMLGQAEALSLDINSLARYSMAAPMALACAGMGFGFLSFLRAKRSAKVLQAAKRKLGEVEYQLNEAEAALQSESQLLLTWPSGAERPNRVIGTLHGQVLVPETLAELIDFEAWLEFDSSQLVKDYLLALRQTGTAFNFGVRTLHGELLEADGRAAGTMVTLRFRPLSGQRLEANANQIDTHKLMQQVARLGTVLDTTPFPVWMADRSERLTWVNAAYLDAAESGDLDAVLDGNVALVQPDSIDNTKADAHSHLLGRARIVRGGKPRTLNVHSFAVDGGQVGFAVDVTELENSEKELDRHIKAHASTLDQLSTAIAIFGSDQRLRFYNQAYQQLWQLDDGFLRANPTDGEILDKLRAERQLPEQANYREWRSKHLLAYTKTEPGEDYWFLPDGRSLRVVCEQHPFGGLSYIYDNLTKEYQLESQLNELFGVQRETLDNLAEAVALLGQDGRLRLYNPAFAKFWPFAAKTPEKLPHVSELADMPALSPSSRLAWQDIKFSVTGLEASRKQHEGRIAQDGRTLHYRAVLLPDGNALLTFSDVSDSVRAELALRERAEALEATDRLKNAILTNVSYEVRTPLNSIMGYSEALDLGLTGPLDAKQHDYVRAIRQSAGDLKLIIDAMIDLSAIDAGQMELKLAEVDVAELLQRTAEKHIEAIEKRQQELSIELASDVNTMIGDQTRLEQVLGNLLSNASGFSAIGSTIRIGAKQQDNMLMIWVTDSGRGIEPEFQNKVFDRFQAKPMPGTHRGPGLGLALVKSFTELHGGKVSLSSKIGHGTTVVCTLPLNGPHIGFEKTAAPTELSNAA